MLSTKDSTSDFTVKCYVLKIAVVISVKHSADDGDIICSLVLDKFCQIYFFFSVPTLSMKKRNIASPKQVKTTVLDIYKKK